jgi:uncharacterized protein YkwD
MFLKKALWVQSIVILVTFLSQTMPVQAASDTITNRMIAAINNERVKYNLKPVVANTLLKNAAQKHSNDMAINDFFGHTSSDGASPFMRMQREGYNFRYAMENVAAGYGTPEAVVAAWMKSPGHRANLLSPNLIEVGVGYTYLANDGGRVRYYHYWTLDGGRR